MSSSAGYRHAACAAAGAALLALVAGAACGPVTYINQVTLKASTAVAAAKEAGARRRSPYYYTLAVEYLHKAREEAAGADYEAANRFGHKSEMAARKAKAEALAGPRRPAPAARGTHASQKSGPGGDSDGAGEVPPGLGSHP